MFYWCTCILWIFISLWLEFNRTGDDKRRTLKSKFNVREMSLRYHRRLPWPLWEEVSSLPPCVCNTRQASDRQIRSLVSLSSYCLKFTKPHFRGKQHNKTGQNKTSIWTWHLWRAQGLGRAQHADSVFKGPAFVATPSRWPSLLSGQWSKENAFSMLGFGLKICTTK